MKIVRLMLIIALAGTAACGGAEEDEKKGGDPFAACSRDVLEADLEMPGPLAGPGVDPATGALKPPPSGSAYMVSTTYLTLNQAQEAQARFGELMGPLQESLAAQAGLVALQFGTSKACGTARTLSIWVSQEGMYDFVLGPAHTEAMSSIGEISRGGSVVAHWEASSPDAMTWEEAARQVGALDGPFY
jgi:hypothetical protein